MSQRIQWFPGHMAKTKRLISENLKLCDVVVEILDARIPVSSKNPMIDGLMGEKPRLVLLNKSDIADRAVNEKWMEYYKEAGIDAMLFSSVTPQGNKEALNRIRLILKDKLERQRARGIVNRPVKIMVAGIPNVGKSAFINCISGRKAMKVENRPGVTRDKQWIKLAGGFELLDTPGILWPKFEDERVGQRLAFCGSIKDEITDTVFLAVELTDFLRKSYPDALSARYGIPSEELTSPEKYEAFERIGRKRGFLIGGGDIDEERTAKMILDEFRAAKIGRISIEKPSDFI
ncbi:MAG: ribosome biogenesis GTPase YlqF [Clostridia bacterium]|nr:ribosome biogenesis GTPase YlqF [Clostridia bacterium]